MTGVPPSSTGRLVVRALVPLIQMFGLYVLFHGHESPGGGFQSGVILASSVLITRLLVGGALSRRLFRPEWAPPLAAGGLLLFFATGLYPLALGGGF
ncbi:MnhB domain-containing protein, partial [bacterium]|nr:MnhB domain-containing protein [bacterium]